MLLREKRKVESGEATNNVLSHSHWLPDSGPSEPQPLDFLLPIHTHTHTHT